ncbi:MAG: LemA family protein [Ruminococcaceae bacterium]|nr:LemA family protein [Oscillospiraceae bacterium]
MKKLSGGIIALIVVGVILLIAVISGVSAYNGLVELEEGIKSKSSQIDNQLQRRADLIPNLVSTVKGYTTHETEAIEAVTSARAKLTGASDTEDRLEANDELSTALSRLLVIVENYPELKADTQFTALTDELSGTESRIATARKDYNDAVEKYNRKIRTFPANIFSGLFGFEKAEYFEADEGASKVPEVNFD